MVLQRGMPEPVWGTAEPGEGVTVKFRDQTKMTKAGGDGKWKVKLDALETGAPATLEVAGTNTLKLVDVLVGEVWDQRSGQSNMENAVVLHAKTDPPLAGGGQGNVPEFAVAGGEGRRLRDLAGSDTADDRAFFPQYFSILVSVWIRS